MIAFNSTIEALLLKHKEILALNYDMYRNHVYRVFLFCHLLDDSSNNSEKYAIASVYHDIGIWTDHTFDYLKPSIRGAEEYLHSINRADWIQEISLMIEMHHKISTYKSGDPHTVEVFRKADWIDVSLGLLKYGLNRSEIYAVRNSIPNVGFHKFLFVLLFKNFMKHPFNPFPIFRL